jgi:myxalamid-type nonribosomal peptide synthetase MxaA
VETEPFTVWNGMLTTIGKLSRPALMARYKAPMESFFSTSLAPLVSPGASREDRAIPDTSGLCFGLRNLLQEVLQLPQGSFSGEDRLIELGADSLALAQLSSCLAQQFGVEIPLPALVKLPSLAVLQTALFGGLNSVRDHLEESNITPEYLTNEVEENWKKLLRCLGGIETPTKRTERKSLLLTGANGFLGAFILQELLQSYKESVTCIIRAKDDRTARLRLEESLKYFRIELSCDEWERVRAIAGDVSLLRFGLSESLWSDLQKDVSAIFHNAAMVNSLNSYAQHRPTNVEGTVNALSFAYGAERIAFHYISTVGLLGSTTEECLEVPLTTQPSSGGYAQSKWVAEQLVCKAHKQFGGSLTIYRPCTIFAHSHSGAANPKDTIIRLLQGLLQERVCLENAPLEGASPLPGQLNVVPVDWAAHWIVQLSKLEEPGPRAYHISSDSLTPLSHLIALIQESVTESQSLTPLPEETFIQRVQAITDANHPLFMYKSIIFHKGYAAKILKPSVSFTQTTITSCGGRPALSIGLQSMKALLSFLQDTNK